MGLATTVGPDNVEVLCCLDVHFQSRASFFVLSISIHSAGQAVLPNAVFAQVCLQLALMGFH